MTLVDPGNPDTSSFAVADIRDGSPLDATLGTFGAAVHYERLDMPDPDPRHAAVVAQERLASLGGAVFTAQLRCVPQPWLEPGQVIAVAYNGSRVVAQVVGWSMDAGPGAEMSVVLRAWRVASDTDMPLYPQWEAGRLSLNAARPLGVDDPPPAVWPAPPESPVEPS